MIDPTKRNVNNVQHRANMLGPPIKRNLENRTAAADGKGTILQDFPEAVRMTGGREISLRGVYVELGNRE